MSPEHDAFSRRFVLAALAMIPGSTLAYTEEDPFYIALPSGYVRSKRKATQGTIFVGGNFPRASIVSVTAWALDELLQQDAQAQSLPGLPAAPEIRKPAARLTSLKDLGSAQQVAMLLLRSRDREASAAAVQSELVSFKFDDQ